MKGRRKTRLPSILTLRCEWCKNLFCWSPPRNTWHLLHARPVTCSDRCKHALRTWKMEKER